ncbi:response regulator [Phycisphaeraceae bacterium D3-23]
MRTQTRPDVLVVDDEQRLRDVLVRGIVQMGFVCDGAPSGEEALRMLREKPRGVAIIDLNLPGIQGMELFEQVRRGWPATQVIVLTGFGDLDTAQQAIRLDVVDFLTKPTHLGELEQALSRAWQRIDTATPPEETVTLPRRAAPPEEVGEDEDDTDGAANGPADDAESPDALGLGEDTLPADASLDELERHHILQTLARHDGNRRQTADALGISLRTLYYRLNRYQEEGLL